MTTVHATNAMIAGMTPVLADGVFIFCTSNDAATIASASPLALATFREDEGTAFVLDLSNAQRLGFDTALPMSRIVLTVFSALDGVGLTAAVATALAAEAIPCNMISAFHHDNVFVPEAMAARAVAVLVRLQGAAKADHL